MQTGFCGVWNLANKILQIFAAVISLIICFHFLVSMGKLIPKFPYRRNARYTTMQGKWMNEQCQLCKGELWQKGTNLPFDEKGTEGKDEEKGEPRFMMLLYSLVTILLSHQAWWAFWSFSIWFKTFTLSVDISRAFSSLKRPFHLKRQNNFYKSSPFSSTISPPLSPYMRILSDQNRKQVDHENKNILFRTLFIPPQCPMRRTRFPCTFINRTAPEAEK